MITKKITDLIKITHLSKILILLLVIFFVIGLLIQYSAGGGDFDKYAFPYAIRFLIGFFILFLIMYIDLRLIYILTDYFYYFSVILLLLVAFIGKTTLGATRWLDLGLFAIQPSELIKISLILILSKYFHKLPSAQKGKLKFYLLPFLMFFVPFILILRQPDLGTSLIVLFITISMFFLSGLRLKYFLFTGLALLLITPIAWLNLHDYQKERVLVLIDPQKDPLGSGYHIIQSKIAIGSGELVGKGFLNGTQAQLDFLPEKHTDFIFTLFAEEFGFIGSIALIILYLILFSILLMMCYQCPHKYGVYIISGLSIMIFIYVFINIGMVSGILPIVGIPLPLISYGGTSIVTIMIGCGLALNSINSKNYI